ncbi:MAG: hypothetical protein QOE96_3784 [Blastocatellia bacterium]|jgi:hypothetical protein|nr:hypothetical protein [Blastocatellia bacterium]
MGETITAHSEMIQKKGSAVFGKIGKGVGSEYMKRLNQQIERGEKTYLFLTTTDGWNGPYATYRCLLKGLYEELPTEKQPLVPEYYLHESPSIKTWCEIADMNQLSSQEMNRIFLQSSGRPIMSVLTISTAVFKVFER